MENRRLQELIAKYSDGQLSNSEKIELNNWFHSMHQAGEDFTSWLNAAGGEQALADEMLIDFRARLTTGERNNVRTLYRRIAIAASVIILVGFSIIFINKYKAIQVPVAYTKFKQPIKPATSGAILTLAGGKQIVLSNRNGGQVATQGNMAITHTGNGSLIYNDQATQSDNGEDLRNTLTTLRGNQMRITLADGTKVWLNAASSITYPVKFSGVERKVEITGEAYLEVVHDAARPFKVIANGQEIEDIGTHFNVNTYADEPVARTTLTEGSIRVTHAKEAVTLIPGQQLKLSSNGLQAVNKVDTSVVLAWKNGLFKFRGASIEDVMRQVSRWYNVSVKYQGTVPDRRFSGEITRSVNLSQVLDILTYVHLQFKIEQHDGQTLITVIS